MKQQKTTSLVKLTCLGGSRVDCQIFVRKGKNSAKMEVYAVFERVTMRDEPFAEVARRYALAGLHGEILEKTLDDWKRFHIN